MKKITRDSIKKLLGGVAYGDTVKPKGHVTVIKKDKYGRVTKRVGYNALSNTAKARVLLEGAKFIGYATPYLLGKHFVSQDISSVYEPSSNIYSEDFSVTPHGVYLLNLTGKETNEHFIPVYNIDGSLNRDVVLGCVNTNNTVSGDDYYGVAEHSADTNNVVGLVRRSDAFFDTGKATGKITHVATMPYLGSVSDTKLSGMAVWRSASKTANVSIYIPPSCPGLTEADEIIVFNEYNGVAGYKININTGGTRELPNTVTKESVGWDGVTARYASLLFDTNKLAVVDGRNCKILQLNGDGTCTELLNKAMNYGTDSCKGIFVFNGYLYFSIGSNSTGTSSAYLGRVLRVDLSSSSYTNTAILNTALTIIGGLPAGWDLKNVCINSYHNGKFYITNCYLNITLVCTDLSDVCGTMVGCFNSGVNGFDIVSTTVKTEVLISNSAIKNNAGNCRAYNNVMDTSQYVQTRNNGANTVWVCDGLYSNYWTLYPLTSPIEKTADDTVEVLYDISWAD